MQSSALLFTLAAVSSVVSSGLLAGALLAEARVLVPFWRKLSAQEFLARHGDMASLLFNFYAPLTVLGTLLPVVTMLLAIKLSVASQTLWISSGLIAIALLGIYFIYFKAANAKFELGELTDAELKVELQKWTNWHNFRTCLACIAFLISVIAIAK